MTSPSLFEQLGGEAKLRRIIDRFVDSVFDDVMIGFFFDRANRARIKAKEYEFAAQHLGADVQYSGRPLREAHARHPIMGGQFMRRLQLLRDALQTEDVPDHIVQHWVEHTESLRDQVTQDSGGRCDPVAAAERVRKSEHS